VRETANAFGGLDFVWNHLGHPGPASVEGIDMADFATAIDLNLRSQIVTTEAALPELKARGGGSLLYTASTSGLMGSQFSPVYSAVKFGVVGFVRALAKRVARDGIRVNAICPGATDTPMLRVFVARPDQQSTQGRDPEQLVAQRAGQNPMGRPARPDEIANAALFLLSTRPRSSPARRCRSTAGRRPEPFHPCLFLAPLPPPGRGTREEMRPGSGHRRSEATDTSPDGSSRATYGRPGCCRSRDPRRADGSCGR
jgi:NAD(P)-dependent dehydrogenase (short-subunit alcohol dehydrogenase family)